MIIPSCQWGKRIRHQYFTGAHLQRIPYRIVIKELNIPAYYQIELYMRNKKSVPLAVKRFWIICNTGITLNNKRAY